MDSLYQEQILEHYKNPSNFGECRCVNKLGGETPPLHGAHNNPSCGDSIEMSLCIEDGTIEDIKFKGSGCAISMASASMLTEKIMGMKMEDVKKIEYSDIEKMLGIPLSSARKKCAYLGLEVLRQILK